MRNRLDFRGASDYSHSWPLLPSEFGRHPIKNLLLLLLPLTTEI
jgi:hypothetical protein